MRHLLSQDVSGVLEPLARSRVLVAFDFDGTLAPIVAEHRQAQMRPRTDTLFAQVCALYPCAVISGRGRADVCARLGSAPIKYVVGNHGLEPGLGGEALAALAEEVRRARAALAALLAGLTGVEIEDKRYSLSVHFRAARARRRTRAVIIEAATRLPVAMRVVPGAMVVNLVPAGAPNKGQALLALRGAEQADTALYVGDDVTDEDVFELGQPGRLLTVRVGESGASAAAYFVRDQQEVDGLLSRLIALRAGPPPG
jgi:trehalose 6-phosphate phosphatase